MDIGIFQTSNGVYYQARFFRVFGCGGAKPSTQFMIGENEWVEGWKWYDAITVRKNGTATQEQIELLDKGHWKE